MAALSFDDLATPDQSFAGDIRQSENSADTAVSPKGAQAAMQVLSKTAAEPGFGVKPAQSAAPAELDRVGDDYSQALLDHYGGNKVLAAAAYNAGPGNVNKWIDQFGDPRTGQISDVDFAAKIPFQETRHYVSPYIQVADNTPAPKASNALTFDDVAPPTKPSGGALSFDDIAPGSSAQAPKDIGIIGEAGAGLEQGVADIGKTVNFIKQSMPAAVGNTLMTTLTAALPGFKPAVESLISGIGLMGQAPAPAPTVGSQPISFKGPLDVGSLAEKAAHGLGESVPMIAAATVGGPAMAGSAAAAQSFGPRYQEEIQKNPNDPQGAVQRAGESASIDGAATALGWKLFEFTPFKQAVGTVTNNITGAKATIYEQTIRDMIQNLVVQGVAIQPAVSVVSQVAHNLMDGKSPTEGLPEAYTQGAVGTTLMMGLSHLIAPPGMSLSPWRLPKGGADRGAPTNGNPNLPQLPPPGGGPSGGGAAVAGLEPGTDIGLPFPDGSVQRATVVSHPAAGIVRLQYNDGTVADHVTPEIQRDAVAPPPASQPEPQPIYRGPQLSQDEREAPLLAEAEAEPVPLSPRAAAKVAARAPQPVLDPQALHALDLAGRLESAAFDPTNPMSTEDRQAALLQAGRLRQSFTAEDQGTLPGAYRHPMAGQERIGALPVGAGPSGYSHPVAGEPAADLGALAAARVANPALYGNVSMGQFVPHNANTPSQAAQAAANSMPPEQAPQGRAVQPLSQPASTGPTVLPDLSRSGYEGAQDADESRQNDGIAAATEQNPTPAQIDAGNYRKGHLRVQGLNVSIETPKNAVRGGIGADGQPWENRNPLAHYGYLTRTDGNMGADGDHVDAYVGQHPNSPVAFVVDQIDPATGGFDEHKAILGANTPKEATAIYNAGFYDGSGPTRMGAITKMPMVHFKEWLKNGDFQKPLDANLDPDYQSAIWDVRDARSKATGDKDLLGTIQAMGGIKLTDSNGNTSPEGQTIRQITQDYRRPGLINNRSGMTPDYLREALMERGWFGDRNDTDIRPLYDMLDNAVRGQKVFHPDSDANSILERRALTDEEMGRAGVKSSDSHAAAAKKLVAFRQNGIEELANHYENAANHEVEKLSPGARELVAEYGYEPGTDYGAEAEPQPEEHQGAPETIGETELEHQGQEHGGAGAIEPEAGRGVETKEPAEDVGYRTTPGAIASEHAAEVSRLEAEGAQAALPDNKVRTAAREKIKALIAEAKPLADKGGLTAAEGARYGNLMRQAHDLQFEIARPLNKEKLPSEVERKSTLSSDIVATAQDDLRRNKSVYDAILDAATGVAFNKNTAIDQIMLGLNRAISPQKLYETFNATRDALRAHFGDTIPLFRAEGRQMEKPTKNWATTPEYAAQFGDNIIERRIPVDDVVAVNVGLNGRYHEIIVGEKPHPPTEAVDLGKGKEGQQTVIPGAERSAKQLAEAREASGHGKVKASAEQKEPGGLFEPKAEPEPDMFTAQKTRMPATTGGARIPPREAEMLTDAGEKIGGARKDKWAERGLRVSDLEGMSEGEAFQHTTKDQVWPKPDYEKMVESGATPKAAAYIKIIRDRLAAKPSVDSAQGRRNYIEMMGHVRDLLDRAKTEGDVKDARDTIVYDRAGVSRERLGTPEDKAAREKLFSVYKDRKEPFGIRYDDPRKADKMIADGFPGKSDPWMRRYAVRQRGNGKYDVTEKSGYRPLSDAFDTKEEAQDQARKLYDTAISETGGKIEPKRPHLDNIERTGKDIRNGRDVTGDDFLKDFGFRGVEFGNWVASDERQKAVNLAYDGLHDLAGVLGIPPETLSLDGQLGLAFGARGSGKFAAHYEPGRLVINLTKLSGAGSLAHEWAHALDHYFGTLDTDKGTRGAPKGASGWYDKTEQRARHLKNLRPEMAEAFDKLMGAIFKRDKPRAEAVRDAEFRTESYQATIDKQKQRMADVQDKSAPASKKFLKDSAEWVKQTELQLEAVQKRLANLRDEAKSYVASKINSSYYDEANNLSGKSGDKGYWSRPTEMFARAFESYVFDKLKQEGNKSQYLVQGVEPERYATGYKGNPYPAGMERNTIDSAFDHLFKTMEVRQGQSGKKTLAQVPEDEKNAADNLDRRPIPVRYEDGIGRILEKLDVTPERSGSAAGETGRAAGVKPTQLEQPPAKFQRDNQPFYSALTRSVENLKQERAPASQWRAIIDNLHGVKKEEVDWSGVKDWLDGQKGSVTKADLLQHLRENEVRVQEVTLGGMKREDTPPDAKAVADYGVDWEKLATQFSNINEQITKTRENPALRDARPRLEQERDRLQAAMDELHDQMVEDTRERMLSSGKAGQREAKFGSYTLPGGQNYRELLLTLPNKADNIKELAYRANQTGDIKDIRALEAAKAERANSQFKSSHFDEPNILAHVRFDDRNGPGGEKILHIAEVQSDWAARARKSGFQLTQKRIAELDARRAELEKIGGDLRYEGKEIPPEIKAEWADVMNELQPHNTRKVPRAPFVGNTESWVGLAARRMLRYAAEHGYDRLSFDTGDTQADRYDLSKTISRVEYYPRTQKLIAFDRDSGNNVLEETVAPDKIADYVGKDVADQLNNQTSDLRRVVEGNGLKVGGAGMKAFYDKILPATVNKIAKKWGAKVEDSTISAPMARPGGLGEELSVRTGQKQTAVHSIPITPAMRDSVMQGQPMFQRGEGTSNAPPKATWLGHDLVAQLPERPTEPEARLIEQINKLAKQIVPTAKVVPAKSLMLVDKVDGTPASDNFQVTGRNIWGATYIDGPRRAIAWSMGSPDAVGTFRHEVIHWLRNLGFFTPKEWGTLVKAADDGNWIAKHDIDRRYQDLDHAGKVEEAIAEEGAAWNRKENIPEPPVRRLFARLRDFLQRTRRYLQSLFGHEATADDIFRDIYSGKVGKRPIDGEPPISEATFAQAAKTPDGPPESAEDGRDYIDQTANDLAEHIRGKGPGTYERELQRLAPPSGQEIFARANWLQQHVMGPRTVAEIDTKSGTLWSAVKAEEAEGQTRLNDLRDNIEKNFLKYSKKEQDEINSVMELDRLDNRTRVDDGRSIVAHNNGHEHARGSKPGDTIIIPSERVPGYFGLQKMYRRAWDNIMEGTARRMGWIRPWSPAMADNLSLINKAVDDADHPRDRKAFQRLADIMNAMDAQRRAAYMPLMRFGDYYISIKPKEGTDMESTGGFPKTAWFEMAERPAMQYSDVDPAKMLRMETTKTGEVPDYAKARIEELKKKFPPAQYRHESGYLMNKPDALRSLSIPAVEKLLMLMESGVMDRLKTDTSMGGMANKSAAHAEAVKRYEDLYGDLVDAVQDEMYEQLKAGFKKKSATVPGYSGDWNRVLGSYMNWTSRHVARQIHGDTIERAYDDIQTHHPHQSIKDFWKKWKQDDDNPLSPISRIGMAANQVGFLWTLAMNPASTFSIMMHGPTYAMPVLSTGIGMSKAGPAFGKAYGEATQAMRAAPEHGLYIDIRKVGKTPDERAFLDALAREGDLHAKGADDVRSMGEKSSAIWGQYGPHAKQAMDVVSSNIGAADQANRVATALAAYRLARDGNLGVMNRVWSANQVWRAVAQRDGVSPETMGRFLLTQGVGEWGGRARSEFGRTPLGRMGTALHGFQIRFLSNLLKQAFRQGGAGRAAMGWTLAALWAGAGLQGLPFVQDAENLVDNLWKAITKHDPMIAWRVRAMLADSGLGKTGADLVLRGPLSVMSGMDFSSRLGFGDVITRDVAPWFGGEESALTFPSIAMGAYSGLTKRLASHQHASAAAEVLPGGLRHPVQAAIDAQHGVKSQTGKTTYVPARKFTAGDEIGEALGLTPLDVARAREHQEYQFRAKNARGSRPRDMTP